jgi:hypothetical protein
MLPENEGFRGNLNLKRANTLVSISPEQQMEWVKCSLDPIYFIENHMKVVSKGKKVSFKLYDWQREVVLSYKNNNRTILGTCRQAGKSTTTVGFILWLILFSSEENPKTIAILANKADVAQEMVQRLQYAYEHVPLWMQQGIKQGGWNKTSIILENGSRVFSAATSRDSISGFTIDFLMIDEVAKIEDWKDFWTASSQTLANNPDAKIAMISTPFGLNHFHDFWEAANFKDAENQETRAKWNGYYPFKITWDMIPGRDEAWKQQTLADLGFDLQQFRQEQEVEFLGSSYTLLSGSSLEKMKAGLQEPVWYDDNLKKYENPIADHLYMLVADVSRGKGLDYSAFIVIDVTSLPFRQVCVYRSNVTTPIDYAQVIGHVAKAYNNAHCLIEINDIGSQVVDALFDDYEYENLFRTTTVGGRSGKRLTTSGDKSEPGIKTTLPTKNQGCYLLKLLVEQGRLEIVDRNTFNELAVFSKKNKSWEAEEGKTDDLSMCCVLFGWLSEQLYFKELTNIDTIEHLRDSDDDDIMEMIAPCFHAESLDNEPQDEWDFPANWLLKL